MIQSIQHEAIVETLLNTLEAERYVRGPLLATIVDELSAVECLEPAAELARAMLDGLESGRLPEADFAARVSALRNLVHALSAPESPATSSVAEAVAVAEAMVPAGEALARAVPRSTLVAGSASAA